MRCSCSEVELGTPPPGNEAASAEMVGVIHRADGPCYQLTDANHDAMAAAAIVVELAIAETKAEDNARTATVAALDAATGAFAAESARWLREALESARAARRAAVRSLLEVRQPAAETEASR